MFIIMLKFSHNKSMAGQLMEGHNSWLKSGFDDGVFMLAGSLEAGLGGGILAHGITRAMLENRLNEDPFVKENVVSAELVELMPAKADERLRFLLD